jgi:hypothetical protein
MPTQAKVFANVFTRKRGSSTGTLNCMIEYLVLTGTPRSGKTEVTLSDLRNESVMVADMKDALVTHLNNKYSPEVFRNYDIVGLSV